MKTKHTQGQWKVSPLMGQIEAFYYSSINKQPTDAENAFYHTTKTICKIETRPLQNTLTEEQQANAVLIAAAPSLMQMVFDLMKCVKRLTEDGLTKEQRDKEAQWLGEAHELLHSINPDYYSNSTSKNPTYKITQ